MALTTPILLSQAAFDANEEHRFTFEVVGGSQFTGNRLTIIDQSTGKIVYDNRQETYSFFHTLPSNSGLENGNYYSAYINTYDAISESANSNSIQFYCYSNPSFIITNFISETVLSSPTLSAKASYSQAEGERLSSYEFNLYDSQGTLIATSGILYVISDNIAYNFSGLANNSVYYIEALGQTSGGTQISTRRIEFIVSYEEPSSYTALKLTNNCKGGYVIINSNLAGIAGETEPYPPLYVYDNNAINLLGDGDYVKWYSGFSLSNDFTASLWGDSLKLNSVIAYLSDGFENTATVSFIKDTNNYYYAQLKVHSSGVDYEIYSSPILSQPLSGVQIWFRRIGNLFKIEMVDLGEDEEMIDLIVNAVYESDPWYQEEMYSYTIEEGSGTVEAVRQKILNGQKPRVIVRANYRYASGFFTTVTEAEVFLIGNKVYIGWQRIFQNDMDLREGIQHSQIFTTELT